MAAEVKSSEWVDPATGQKFNINLQAGKDSSEKGRFIAAQQMSDGGYGLAGVVESIGDWRGNYPATWYLEFQGTAGSADNDVIYQSGDVSMYNHHAITVSGVDNADVYGAVDGTNYVLVSVELTDDVTTGGGVKVVTIPPGKTGIVRGKYKKIRVLQDGATTANCIGAHSVE